MLIYKYKLFKMKQIESIIEMFTRFIDIITSLKNLENSYTNSELVRKKSHIIFWSLGG